jgi:hypothetical protein
MFRCIKLHTIGTCKYDYSGAQILWQLKAKRLKNKSKKTGQFRQATMSRMNIDTEKNSRINKLDHINVMQCTPLRSVPALMINNLLTLST